VWRKLHLPLSNEVCEPRARIADMVLRICEAGEIVLREAARELTSAEILSPEIQELIGSMYDTMRAAPGVGVAAPQIGLPLQLAVIEDRQEYIDKAPPETGKGGGAREDRGGAARHH
jgi:peptide deformylase